MEKLKQKLQPIFNKYRRVIPVVAFFGGFIWDAVALGRSVKTFDLLRLGLYFTVAFIFLILLSATLEGVGKNSKERNAFFQKISQIRSYALDRNLSSKWRFRFSYVLQFCYGGLFSALVVCYFKSSGSVIALLFVGMLSVFFVSNEFLQKSYEERFSISLALFSIIGTMYFNFLIPHIVASVHFVWFVVAILLSLLLCMVAQRVAHKRFHVMILPAIISGILLMARICSWIPPVPLVLKDQNACLNFNKDYSCEIAKPTFSERIGLTYATVYVKPLEPVYFLSSVYAPEKVEASLEHRWYYKDPKTNAYELKSTITSDRMVTHGSREAGFRIYTKKQSIQPGRWKVETAVKDGAVIGAQTFYIKEFTAESPERMEWKIQ